MSAVWGPDEGSLAALAGAPRWKLEGRRTNHALVGAIKKWNLPFLGSGAGYFDSTGTAALAFVSSDGLRVEVLTVDKDRPAIIHFTRSVDPGSSVGGKTAIA